MRENAPNYPIGTISTLVDEVSLTYRKLRVSYGNELIAVRGVIEYIVGAILMSLHYNNSLFADIQL